MGWVSNMRFIYTKSVREISDLIFSCENMVDFNETSLLDLDPSYARVNFSRLSIASVDGKQHFSEVVFNALVEFSVLETYPTFEQPEV